MKFALRFIVVFFIFPKNWLYVYKSIISNIFVLGYTKVNDYNNDNFT